EKTLKQVPEWPGGCRSPQPIARMSENGHPNERDCPRRSLWPNAALRTRSPQVVSRSGSVEWHGPPPALDYSFQVTVKHYDQFSHWGSGETRRGLQSSP